MSPEDTLDRIPRGQRVRVIGVNPLPSNAPNSQTHEGTDPIARRLDDLGIRQGVAVEVIRRAPLGDPTVFELHGYQLCLRRSESSRVRVRLDDSPAKRERAQPR